MIIPVQAKIKELLFKVKQKRFLKILLIIILALVIFFAIAASAYFYTKKQANTKLPKTEEINSTTEDEILEFAKDEEAKTALAEIKAEADSSFGQSNAAKCIHEETGVLAVDDGGPKIDIKECKKDFEKVYYYSYSAYLSNDAVERDKYKNAALYILDDWQKVNITPSTDPIEETQYDLAIRGYSALRALLVSPGDDAKRISIEAWLYKKAKTLAFTEPNTVTSFGWDVWDYDPSKGNKLVKANTRFNPIHWNEVGHNHKSHRLKTVGVVGLILKASGMKYIGNGVNYKDEGSNLVNWAEAAYKDQIRANLNAMARPNTAKLGSSFPTGVPANFPFTVDEIRAETNKGASVDYFLRDSLSYHVYNLVPLLTFAAEEKFHGRKVNNQYIYYYSVTDTNSGYTSSLSKAIDFLTPYILGAKHQEFVQSLDPADIKRHCLKKDSNGNEIKPYNPSWGTNYCPIYDTKNALLVYELDTFFKNTSSRDSHALMVAAKGGNPALPDSKNFGTFDNFNLQLYRILSAKIDG